MTFRTHYFDLQGFKSLQINWNAIKEWGPIPFKIIVSKASKIVSSQYYRLSLRVNYGRPSVTDYRQAECLDNRQTNWLACEQLGPLDSAAMR